MRRLAVCLALLLAGCGGEASSGGGDPATALPPGAAVYLDVTLRPEGVQEAKLTALAGRVLGTDDPGERIVELIERAAEEPGTYARDVEPWLGERAGLAITGLDGEEPQFTAAIAARDADAAAEAVERLARKERARRGEHGGSGYWIDEDGEVLGVAGDFVLIADSETAMRAAIDAGDGDSLADGERFEQAIEPLPDDRVGTIFVDVRALARQAGALDPQAAQVLGTFLGDAAPVAVAALAGEDHLALESRVEKGGGALGRLSGLGASGASELIGELPGESWGAVGVPQLGRTARETLQLFAGPLGGAVLGGQLEQELGISLERDVFSWLGDVALFVRGDAIASVDGGAVIEVLDAARARAALPKLLGALRVQAGLAMQPVSLEGATLAFELGAGAAPKPIVVALADERAVIAYGREAALAGLDPDGALSGTDRFERAGEVLDGLTPSFLLDPAALLELIEASVPDADVAAARPYLERLDVVAAGSATDGDEIRSRFAVGVK